MRNVIEAVKGNSSLKAYMYNSVRAEMQYFPSSALSMSFWGKYEHFDRPMTFDFTPVQIDGRQMMLRSYVREGSYSSQHQWGIAFDIAINDSKLLYNDKLIRKVAKIAKSKKVGLKWGGNWKSIVDTPHFYLGKWGSTTKKLKKTYGFFDKFKKTWTGKLRCNTYLRKGRLFTSKKLMTIKKGETVRILWKSKVSRVAKIEYAGKYGFIRLKNLA